MENVINKSFEMQIICKFLPLRPECSPGPDKDLGRTCRTHTWHIIWYAQQTRLTLCSQVQFFGPSRIRMHLEKAFIKDFPGKSRLIDYDWCISLLEWEKGALAPAIKIQIDFKYQRHATHTPWYLFRAWPKWYLDVISLAERNQSPNGAQWQDVWSLRYPYGFGTPKRLKEQRIFCKGTPSWKYKNIFKENKKVASNTKNSN